MRGAVLVKLCLCRGEAFLIGSIAATLAPALARLIAVAGDAAASTRHHAKPGRKAQQSDDSCPDMRSLSSGELMPAA